VTVDEQGLLSVTTTDERFPYTPDGFVRLGMAIGAGDYAYAGIDSTDLHRLISRGQAAAKSYRVAVPEGSGSYAVIETFTANSLDEALSHATFVCENLTDWVLVDGLGSVIGAHRT